MSKLFGSPEAQIVLAVGQWWTRHEVGKWLLSRKHRQERRRNKRLQRAEREAMNEIGALREPVTEDGMKYLKSRTIQGILASGVAAVLGLVMGNADASTLAPQVFEWLLNGVELGGLVYAARGRKLATGPL